MAQTGANLVDHVLPRVPLRQFVVTVPFELRARLAYDGALLGAVGRIVVDSVLGFYRRRMRDEGGVVGQSGAVSVVQRASADLRLNPHWHSILLDGVFAPDGQGALVFHQLRNLDTCQLADLLQVIRVRVLGYLERRGVIENQGELTVLDGDLCEREPALAQLAAAAVSGLTPAGPEERCRPPITLRGQLGVQVSAPLSVAEVGFSLHAATCASADDARGREALVRYALRPPIAQERLHLLANDLVRIELRRPFRDGTVAVDLDPLSLLCRLAAMVPTPHSHTVHYSGVLGAASKWRSLVVPPPPLAEAETGESSSANPEQLALPQTPPPSPRRSLTYRSTYRPWAELLMRTFAIDVEQCPSCGGRMKLRALVTVTAPCSVERFLRHLGEPTEPPPLSAARDPPFFKSRAVRRKLGDLYDEYAQA
jgi:hypothetical protein